MTPTLSDIPATMLALLFFLTAALLFRRWQRTHDGMIIASGVLPRLAAGLVYAYFAAGELGLVPTVPITLRGSMVRGLWALLLLSELLNHLVLWQKGKIK